MVDQIPSIEICRGCGSPLDENRVSTDTLCANCLTRQADPMKPAVFENMNNAVAQSSLAQSSVIYGDEYASAEAQPDSVLDPDRPHWGPVAGIGIWMFSVASTIAVPVAALFAWYLLDKQRGLPVPVVTDATALLEYVQSPRILLVQVYSTIIAHIITLAFCWMVVTNLRKRPFLASLGWHWAGRSPLYWLLFSAGVVASVIAADAIFKLFLPQAETPFEKLLSSSYQIKVAVAILATFSAPFTEEVVYRGVLYGGLRKAFGIPTTIIGVTILFAGVHFPQYWGAWASLAGLMMLSLILTIVRAQTKSILPSVIIHLVNNGFISLFLVLGK